MMNSKSTRDIEVSLNRKQIEDQVASLLYAYGVVKDNEEILNIKVDLSGDKDACPVSFKIRKNSEVKTIQHNG